MHLLSLFYQLACAVVAIVFNLYQNDQYLCGITPLPNICGDEEKHIVKSGGLCVERSNLILNQIFFYLLCASVVVLISWVVGSMIVVSYTVKKQYDRIRRNYGFTDRMGAQETNLFYQAGLYGFCFFLVFFWSLLEPLVRTMVKRAVFPLVVVSKLFYPLQGFFNFIVFIRPRVKRLHQQPDATYAGSFIAAIFFPDGSKGRFDCTRLSQLGRVSFNVIERKTRNPIVVERQDSLNSCYLPNQNQNITEIGSSLHEHVVRHDLSQPEKNTIDRFDVECIPQVRVQLEVGSELKVDSEPHVERKPQGDNSISLENGILDNAKNSRDEFKIND